MSGPRCLTSLIATGRLDRRSLVTAAAGGLLYFALAVLSVELSRFDGSLAAVWLPSAVGTAILLRARLANEWPFVVAAFAASTAAHAALGSAPVAGLVFSLANMVTMVLATGLSRKPGRPPPDMRRLSALSRVVWAGGLVGPLASAAIVGCAIGLGLPGAGAPNGAPAVPGTWQTAWQIAGGWFLGDSMAMILIVPTALLIADALALRQPLSTADLAERAALLGISALAVILVFGQNAYPLLFLIPPITLLHAFRLGSLGTALHVMIVALVATGMTWAQSGPIYEASASPTARLHLIQAFIAANFLTGLPIAAILTRRDRLITLLGERRREIALLTDSITDAVLKLDARGVCTYASPSAREVLGRDPAELVGRPINQRTHPDARAAIGEVLGNLLGGRSDKERLTYRRLHDDAQGKPVFIEADCAITLDPVTQARAGVVVSARDVTARVELEALLTRARRTAEDAARAKTEFLANMSHEIRTPMNGVLGFAELMLQGELQPEARRHTEMIVQSGRSMMLLLNDILDLSKIEAGQIAIDSAPVDLLATLEECAALHRPSVAKKGLELHLDCTVGEASDPRLTRLLSDGLRLRQIMLNLIGNAVKFTQAGTIHVSAAIAGDAVCVRVADTGIGISAARLETIFVPFTQGETSIARRFGGTGLGLSISRHLAELLGGTITAESTPGEGSVFTLRLPARFAEAVTAPSAPALLQPDIGEALPQALPRDARILLAEDHDVNRLLMTEMLERCGQSVATAHDGNEAIAMVMDSLMRGAPYDLVLMDVQMPGCDGYAATRAIREDGIGPDVLPIIALTANAYPEDVAAARAAGMQAHLAKPLVFADLARALQRWLPSRIIETPMDRDPGTPGAADAAVRSAALHSRWITRRCEAIKAVREALAGGFQQDENAPREAEPEALIRHLHKLAGTAASFGEPELGEQAAALETALRQSAPAHDCAQAATRLLVLADAPASADARTAGQYVRRD